MKPFGKIAFALGLALTLSVVGIGMHLREARPVSAQAEGVELPIVMYHHLLKEQARLNKYTISPEELRTDLQYLKENGYTPVVIQDLLAYVNEGTPLPERPIVITFDDGYESFHEYAFPLLKEYGFRSVYSIVGRYADEYSKMDDHHIRYSHSTWNELALLQESGLVEIQNHSYNLHENDKGRKGSKKKPGETLPVYRELLMEDLGKLQAACAANLNGWKPTCFTYPFGHISPEALPILKEMGFSAALTCQERLNYLTGDPEELFHLNRYNRAHGESLQELLRRANSN